MGMNGAFNPFGGLLSGGGLNMLPGGGSGGFTPFGPPGGGGPWGGAGGGFDPFGGGMNPFGGGGFPQPPMPFGGGNSNGPFGLPLPPTPFGGGGSMQGPAPGGPGKGGVESGQWNPFAGAWGDPAQGQPSGNRWDWSNTGGRGMPGRQTEGAQGGGALGPPSRVFSSPMTKGKPVVPGSMDANNTRNGLGGIMEGYVQPQQQNWAGQRDQKSASGAYTKGAQAPGMWTGGVGQGGPFGQQWNMPNQLSTTNKPMYAPAPYPGAK